MLSKMNEITLNQVFCGFSIYLRTSCQLHRLCKRRMADGGVNENGEVERCVAYYRVRRHRRRPVTIACRRQGPAHRDISTSIQALGRVFHYYLKEVLGRITAPTVRQYVTVCVCVCVCVCTRVYPKVSGLSR
jgi:hypothetical protein